MTQKLLTPTISISHQNNQLFTISLFKRSHASQRTLTKLALDSSCCTANQFNMAATTNDFSKNSVNLTLLLLAIIISSIHHLPVHSLEFQVGGNRGWVVPPANDSKIYNDWASENRFQVGDTIRFKYKKDSVMEVTDKEYKKCNSTHPIFFSNTGNTAFRLDHPGPFYFISGASGHCEKGQRMIIKVMYHEESSPSTGDDHGHKSSASPAAVLALAVSKLAIVQFLLLLCTTASYLY